MATWRRRSQHLEGDYMGVTLERGVAYQFDLAGATSTGTWNGARDLAGTPILIELESRCQRGPRGATWFGRLSAIATVDGLAIADGTVSSGGPYGHYITTFEARSVAPVAPTTSLRGG